MVRVGIPQCLGPKTREAMVSDPTALRLRDKSPAVYNVALAIAKVSTVPDAARLPAIARAALAERAGGVIDKAEANVGQDVSDFVDTLPDVEHGIFAGSYAFARDLQRWRARESIRMRSPDSAGGRKRRRG